MGRYPELLVGTGTRQLENHPARVTFLSIPIFFFQLMRLGPG